MLGLPAVDDRCMLRPHSPVVLEVVGVWFDAAAAPVRYRHLGEERAKGLPEIRDTDR